MLIYQGPHAIKIISLKDETTEEIEKEYGKRNIFIVDEKNFKDYHFCINEKYNYWLPIHMKDNKLYEWLIKDAKNQIRFDEAYIEKNKKNQNRPIKYGGKKCTEKEEEN